VPTIRANGLDIAYDVHGAGPPLVLLHGATSIGPSDFAAQIPLFSRAFHLYLPDARGHGRTRWDAGAGFRYDWLVDDLEAFVEGIGLETFHLVGFSMGAMTGLQYAVRHPERLRTLTVVGITTQREPRASVARRLMDPARADRVVPAWGAELGRRHDEGQGAGAWRRLLPAIAADVAVQPLLTPRDLRRIDGPTLVVCGDRDPFVPVDHAWGLRRQLPDGRLLVVPDCGHEVMSRKPSLFNEALAGFFRTTATLAGRRATAFHTGAASDRLASPAPRRPSIADGNPLAEAPAIDRGTDRDWLTDPTHASSAITEPGPTAGPATDPGGDHR
jgi:pimeloyl-ACP methyl ester carboxylesterase